MYLIYALVMGIPFFLLVVVPIIEMILRLV
jgi:hypothetical protein